MTQVAGKWRCLFMAGDDDEVYDKKPQTLGQRQQSTEQHL